MGTQRDFSKFHTMTRVNNEKQHNAGITNGGRHIREIRAGLEGDGFFLAYGLYLSGTSIFIDYATMQHLIKLQQENRITRSYILAIRLRDRHELNRLRPEDNTPIAFQDTTYNLWNVLRHFEPSANDGAGFYAFDIEQRSVRSTSNPRENGKFNPNDIPF